jgi:hypothetical protein
MAQQVFDRETIGQIAQVMIWTARTPEFATGVAALALALGVHVTMRAQQPMAEVTVEVAE